MDQLLCAWLFAKFIMTYEICAANPTGSVVVISSWLLEHQEKLDWYDWDWPDLPSYTGELSTPLKLMREGFGPLSRFLFLDPITGTIAVSSRRPWLEAEQARTGDAILALAEVTQQLDNWALWVRPSEIPPSVQVMLKEIGFNHPLLDEDSSQSPVLVPRGRPRKGPEIAAAYSAFFPEGQGRLQREQVRRSLEHVVKFGFSLNSLDSALRLIKAPSSSDDL